MLTMNQTPGKECDIIWVIRIDMDGSYMYFSTEYDKLTLDGIDFDGKVIEYPGDMEEGIVGNAIDGGNIGIVSNFTFSIMRYNDYSGASNFFNDFYPATSKPLLTAKTVDVGIIWRGATTLSQITWLKQYYIQDPKFYRNKIECFCVEFDELSGKQLPYYTVQKDKDNGISYFPNAPDESFDKIIPIIYGDFASAETDLIYLSYNFAPFIRIDKVNNSYLGCSHICDTVATPFAYIYRYIDEAKTMMLLTGDTSSVVNTRRGHLVNMSSSGSIVHGSIYLPLTKAIAAGYFTYIDSNCIDNDPNTFTIVPSNTRLGFQLGYNLSELGTLYKVSTYVQLRAIVKSNDANNQLVTLGTYYSNIGADNDPSGYLLAADSDSYATPTEQLISTTLGEILTEAFTVEDLTKRYFMVNTEMTNSASINLYHIYVMLSGIKVYDDRQLQGYKVTYPKTTIIHLGGFR